MSKEWLYRASDAQEDGADTRELAQEHGFICRNPYTQTTQKQHIALVKHVGTRDIIHLYFADSKTEATGELLGAYRVVAPFKHPAPDNFGPAVTGTTLRRVASGPLLEALQQRYKGYLPDADGAYYGWPVIPDECPSPSYRRELFPTRNSLRERP
jgi:hypothetical protein